MKDQKYFVASSKMKILFVEDDLEFATVIANWLIGEGYDCTHVASGRQAQAELSKNSFDLIILDWLLPDLDGIEVLKKYRLSGGRTPVLMLTGRQNIESKVFGFESGADDYLSKPFDGKELSARVKAMFRRSIGCYAGPIVIGPIELNSLERTVRLNELRIELTPREFDLLEVLMHHPRQILPTRMLLSMVWHNESGASADALSTCVRRLRNKLDSNNKISMIRNVHGVGYGLFVDPRPN